MMVKLTNVIFLIIKRTTLPVRGHSEVNLCSVLSLGKELSKVTMPVNFNEPLSFLQRVAEYMEYAKLLKLAAAETTPVGRLQVNYFHLFPVEWSIQQRFQEFNQLVKYN